MTGSVNTTTGMVGISLIANTVRIYNNVVANLTNTSTTLTSGNYRVYGIMMNTDNTLNPYYDVFHNSVYLKQTTAVTSGTGVYLSAAVDNDGGLGLTGINLINNIFVNESTVGTIYSFSLPNRTKSYIVSTSDNNLYYPANFNVSGAGTLNTLALYKTALASQGAEQNSISTASPLFTNSSTSDLSITDIASPANNAGKVVASSASPATTVTTDILGVTRYASAPDLGAYEINSSQSITFGALADKTYGSADFQLNASASSGLAVSYTSSNTAVATVSGNTVSIKAVGSTNITASQDGNGSYSAASNVTRTLSVVKATPTLSLTSTSVNYNGSAQAATVNGSVSGSATNVKYDGSATAPTAVGSYAVTADFAPADVTNYASLTGASAGTFSINTTVPGAPTIGTATAGNAQASVAFTAPSNNGGSTILDYTVTPYIGATAGTPVTGSASPIIVTGLTNGTSYTFTVIARNSAGSSSASDASNSVTPISPSVNVVADANLSSYSPSSATDVTVTAGTLTVDADANVKTLTVAPGAKLTLASGKTLTVAAALTLQSDDSHPTATLVNNGGTISAASSNVEQYLTSGRNWYVSSPVSGAKSDVLSASSGNPVYWYDELYGSTAPWASITNTTTDLTVMKGYVANLASTGVVTFSGSLNTTGSITLSRTTGQLKEGFNLVGNPYPAHTTITKSITDAANALNTIWYRTATWDAVHSKYVYTFQTCLLNSNGSYLGTPVLTTPTIAPMQAFWVRSSTNGSTLDFSTAAQSHQSANPLKAPEARSLSQEMLRLQVTNSDAIADETVLYFNPNASNNFDSYDAQKMFNNSASVAEIYTVAGTDELAINGLNTIPYDIEMPLGFNTVAAGTFSIKASQIANFALGTQVILKDYADVSNPVISDLSDGSSYSFNSGATSNNTSRFALIFRAPSVATGINSGNNSNVWISSRNGQLVVNGTTNNKTMLEVFNAVGQKVISRNMIGSTIDLNTSLVSGAYLVRVTFEGKSITRKIIID